MKLLLKKIFGVHAKVILNIKMMNTLSSSFFLLLVHLISCVPIFLIDFVLKLILVPKLILRTKEGKRLFSNIDYIFALPKHNLFAKRFAKQNLRYLALIFIDSLREFSKENSTTFEGLDELKANMTKAEKSNGQGHIIVTAHIGAWELLGKCAAKATDKKLYALAKPSKFHFVNTLLERIRLRFNLNILWTKKLNFQRETVRILKSHQWLAFIMDQKPANRRGPVVSFFGQATEFVSGPASLALKYNSSIIIAFCIRKSASHYIIKSEYLGQALDFKEEGVDGLTQILATKIEEIIRVYPEQWPWSYKRWKR